MRTIKRKMVRRSGSRSEIGSLVQSIHRGLAVLECLANHPEGLGVSAVSKEINLYKSSAHRILNTFVHNKYVEQNPLTEQYHLSCKIFELSQKVLRSNRIVKVASPFLEKLAVETGESASLVIVDRVQNKLLVCDEHLSSQKVSTSSELGLSLPLQDNATTNVFLSGLSEEELDELIQKPQTLWTDDLTRFQEIRRRLHYVRESGYAVDWGHDLNETSSIAAAIKDRNGRILAIIRLAAPSFRMREAQSQQIAQTVRKIAKEISNRIGFIPSELPL